METWDWDILLTDIRAGQVIPVIGAELLEVEVDGESVLLYEYLAEYLLERLELDRSSLPEDYGFNEVVSEFLVQQPTHPKHFRPELIYYIIRQALGDRDWGIPAPLKQLAAIQDFKLIVSTTFDSLMGDAMAEVHGEAARCLSYRIHEPPEDLPDAWQHRPDPTVYHVFGKVNEMNDFAVTDDDILCYVHRLQSFDRQPTNLFDQFRKKRILALGCGFPGWLTRFFLAGARGDDLFKDGMPGHLADHRVMRSRDLVGFLERKKTTVYTEGGAKKFVSELSKHWSARFGDEVRTPAPEESVEPARDMEAEAVFISFRSDDRNVARQVAKRFEQAGIATWFDETELEAGDRYKEKIAMNIQHCFAFVPLISDHSLKSDARPWFYRYEWKKAIEAAEFRDAMSQFILPLVVDDTPPDDPRIPGVFRDRHVSRFSQLEPMIEAVRKRIRERRLGGRRP